MTVRTQEFTAAIVVVLYYPDEETINHVATLGFLDHLVVAVINAIDHRYVSHLKCVTGLQLIENASNVGLAKAINQGCSAAFKLGATHVMVLDQDSRPDACLASNLLADFIEFERTRGAIAAIGPRLVDVKGEEPSKEDDSANVVHDRFTTVDTLATSGTLISKSAFDRVGRMYEWLFIDDIDHEWCFRAKSRGYSVVRSNCRAMLHNMGDGGVTLLGRYRPLHRSPIRHYYITRNSVYLSKQPYVRFGWRMTELLKLIYRIPIYFIISTNRVESVKNIILGLGRGIYHQHDSTSEKN
jgi:rhamnosyltransferase